MNHLNVPKTDRMCDLTSIDEKKLCFNTQHFNRSDFNVERFINLTRRRATLDQIHNDLRVYLRHLQNAMIELINDDYADFVNLSSSLASLKETIQKITTNIEHEWNEYSLAISELEQIAKVVEDDLGFHTTNKNLQFSVRNRLLLTNAVERLAHFIYSRPKVIRPSWFNNLSRLVIDLQLWFNRIPSADLPKKLMEARDHCFSELRIILSDALVADLSFGRCEVLAVLIGLLPLINHFEFAVNQVSDDFTQKILVEFSQVPREDLQMSMKLAFDAVIKLRRDLIDKSHETLQFTTDVETFIDKSLLKAIESILNKEFSFVLVPSDTKLFHRCFLLATQFVKTYPAKQNEEVRSSLRMIPASFSLAVYFKLITQPLMEKLKLNEDPSLFKLIASIENATHLNCLSVYSSEVFAALKMIFDDNVYLHSIMDKSWEFLLKILKGYLAWTTSIIGHYSSIKPENLQKAKQGSEMESWLALTVLSKDIVKFDTCLFDLCLNTFWSHLRSLGINTQQFGQCLSYFSEQINIKRKSSDEALVTLLATMMINHLSGVSEIPRQYRWTKKPAPTSFSSYMVSAFSVCDQFSLESKKFLWKDDEIVIILGNVIERSLNSFCERAEKVLDLVDQTGSSLQRFKQRKPHSDQHEQHSVDTDEAKIRAQIIFDVNLMKQRVNEYNLPTDRLELIEQRGINPGAAS